MSFAPVSEEEERIARLIVECAYTVHTALGPTLMEHVYKVPIPKVSRDSSHAVGSLFTDRL